MLALAPRSFFIRLYGSEVLPLSREGREKKYQHLSTSSKRSPNYRSLLRFTKPVVSDQSLELFNAKAVRITFTIAWLSWESEELVHHLSPG